MHRKITALLFTLLLSLQQPEIGQAQGEEFTIISNDLSVDYPKTAAFRLKYESGLAVTDAVLTYQVGQNSCLSAGTRVPIEVAGSELSWTWVMSRSGNPPPGAKMWWQWTLTDESGAVHTTPRQEYTFVDDRFNWRTLKGGGDAGLAPLNLHWYVGDDVGLILIEAAEAGLARLQEEMSIVLQEEVDIFIYADAADMREAVLSIQEWAGGVAFSEYNTVLIGVPPYLADTWGTDTVRHELAHLVIDQFGQSCVGGGRPSWLNEGLAMYAEGDPSDTVLEDLAEGLANNSFEPVRSLNGPFPAQGDAASAAYSQSYSLIDFLLESYGQEAIQQLLLVLADGQSFDGALEAVYGFNADGLESRWREYIGAPTRQIPPTPTPVTAASVPTIVPLAAAEGWPTPAADSVDRTERPTADPDPASNSTGFCGLAPVPLLAAGLAAGLAWRGRKRTGT